MTPSSTWMTPSLAVRLLSTWARPVGETTVYRFDSFVTLIGVLRTVSKFVGRVCKRDLNVASLFKKLNADLLIFNRWDLHF